MKGWWEKLLEDGDGAVQMAKEEGFGTPGFL